MLLTKPQGARDAQVYAHPALLFPGTESTNIDAFTGTNAQILTHLAECSAAALPCVFEEMMAGMCDRIQARMLTYADVC
jgi:hypothetical protein